MAKSVLGNNSATEYYPLEIGNEWQYQHRYFTKEMVGPDDSRILISSKAEKRKDVWEFRGENGTAFMYRTKDGIISSSGFWIIKDPLNQGEQWSSGIYNYDQRRHRVESVGLSVVVQGKTYHDCVRIISQSDFHSFLRDEQSVSLSFESRDVYCPQVGPVMMETFEVAQTGARKMISRSELISFKTGQSVKGEPRKEEKPFKQIEVNESFRFPEKGFYRPSLSPDDRWLVYHHSSRQDGSQPPPGMVQRPLYYSELTKSEKKLLPLSGRDENDKLENLADHVEWSDDSKILALSARKNGSDHIILVDFSGATPKFLESFKAAKNSFQWVNRSLLYLNEQSQLMRKIPNKDPESILNPGSNSMKVEIDSFQCAKEGTLLYRGGRKIFKTDLKNPESRLIHEGSVPLRFELSATGRFAFFLNTENQNPIHPNATLHDLKTNKSYHLPVPVKKALFSRDGRRLAYIEKTFPPHHPSKESKRPHFFILDTGNMEVRDYGFHVSDTFAWTPEGNHILYSMKPIHPSLASYENGIFMIQVSDGKEIAKLTSINAAASPVISFSGKMILWEGMDMDTFFVVKNPFY